jgi:DDE superfamily endonuclease
MRRPGADCFVVRCGCNAPWRPIACSVCGLCVNGPMPCSSYRALFQRHSAHISRQTKTWLAAQPAGRFEFTFTPKHGSWLNLVEGFFSKFAGSVLRHIRVTSKHELKQRIMAGINDVNRYPVVHTWSYKLAEAA